MVLAAVVMEYGEPKERYMGVGPRKLKKITKRQTRRGGPMGQFVGRTRKQTARERFGQIEAGRLTPALVAALERDYVKEFARFRAQRERRARTAAAKLAESRRAKEQAGVAGPGPATSPENPLGISGLGDQRTAGEEAGRIAG